MANCKVIAVTNQKGGVGKTTTTANLGIGLAQENKRVLLIDADAQNSLTLSLGYPKPDDLPVTLTDIIQSVIDDKPIPDGHGILHHGEGVDLLPANITLSGMEIRLINAMNRERALRTYINEIKPHYDYILIDCMPSLGIMPLNSLAAADSVIIPSQPSFLSAKGLDLLMHSISQVKRQINPKLKIDGILFTMVDSRTNEAKEIIASLRSHYGEKIRVFRTEIPFSVRAAETSGRGKSIYGKQIKAYCRFVDETHAEIGKESYHICEFAERMEACGAVYLPAEPPMPEMCYSTLPSSGEVIKVFRGDRSYIPMKMPIDTAAARKYADDMNRRLGVSKAQEAAMLAGSMFGWSVPAADPKNYDENGTPRRPKQKDRGDAR